LEGGLNVGGYKTRDLPQIPVADIHGKITIRDAIVDGIGVQRQRF
jgi:hypothetical protein